MTDFGQIEDAAKARVGGEDRLAERLPTVKVAEDLIATPDDRYLSAMSRRVFRAGLKHTLVDGKWPAFEEVFFGFQPAPVRAMSDEDLEALMGETRIIRHWAKIKSVRANAAAMMALAEEAGCFGRYLAGWPGDDCVGLWADLAKRFTQMGGNSGPRLLRMVGRDTFILTDDVARALVHWQLLDELPKGKTGQKRAQDAINLLAKGSGRPLGEISMVLACSVD